MLEFRPKYRPMRFELRVFPHDHYGDETRPYAKPELLVAQDTQVSEVIDLLCNQKLVYHGVSYVGIGRGIHTHTHTHTAVTSYLSVLVIFLRYWGYH